MKCVGSPCRIIYTVFGKPPVSLLKLFDYNNISSIIGYPDDLKLKSSMTLFYIYTKNPLFKQILDKYYQGEMDNHTLRIYQTI